MAVKFVSGGSGPARLRNRGGTFWHLFALALSLSVSLGAIDTLLGLAPKPALFASLPNMLLPGAVTTVFAFVLFWAFWLLVGYPSTRLFGLSPVPLAGSMALFLGTLFVLGWVSDSIQFEAYLRRPLDSFIQLALVAAVSAGMAQQFYALARRASKPEHVRAGGMLLSAGPVALWAAVAWAWVLLYGFESLRASFLFLATAALCLMVALALVNLRAWSSSRRNALVLACLAAVIVLAPGLILLEPAPRPVGAASPEVRHRVAPIVLITVDALRKDALSCYDPAGPSTPHIDALARQSLQFQRAYSPASWTLPAMASIMSGLTPDRHGAVTQASRLPEDVTTLAERLQSAGYRTCGIGYNTFLTPGTRMDQGFAEFDFFPKEWITDPRTFGGQVLRWAVLDRLYPRRASSTDLTDKACAWLDAQRGKDFFLWVHYFDPHMPYAPPPADAAGSELIDRFGAVFDDKDGARIGHFGTRQDQREWVRALYDAEVRYVDREVGRLLDKLRGLGLYDDSLIILTTDHGEEFWDHGNFEHGHTLYDELINVPLVIKRPGAAEGAAIDVPLSTGSLAATVLDLAGVPYDSEEFSYGSVARLLDAPGEAVQAGPLVSSTLMRYDSLEALVHEDYKYIRSRLTGREQLFDLRNDPGEERDLAPEQPARTEMLRGLMDAYREALPEGRPAAPAEEDLSHATHEELESLGYI